MSYIKTDPQPVGLNPGETAVTLDDGTIVAVQAAVADQVQQPDGRRTGFVVVTATARAINADGTPVTLPDGSPAATACHRTVQPGAYAPATDLTEIQRCCLMAVLGEPTAPLWTDPAELTTLAGFSIRNALAAAAHAGPVDAGALL